VESKQSLNVVTWMAKRSADATAVETFSVKCSLGRLLAPPRAALQNAREEQKEVSARLRDQIEASVEKLHSLAFKGSLVATDVLLRAAREGRPLPHVDDQQWWYQCIVSTGTLKGKRKARKDVDIETSAQALFGASSAWNEMDNLWPFISELARDCKTACQNMVASTFHEQLLKAFKREVILWQHFKGRSIPKDIVFKIINHYVRLVTGHATQTRLTADELPLELGQQLEAMANRWKQDFSEALPCPHSSFIFGLSAKQLPKLRLLLEWMYELQVHRASCIQALQEVLPPSSSVTAEQLLAAAAKPQGLLPVSSYKVKCIAVSPTGLKSLLTACRLPIGLTFRDCFPGIRRFLRGGRITSSDYIRTDGISASVTLERTALEGPPTKRSRGVKLDDTGPQGPRPVLPLQGQKLIAIDPGRREMIYGVTVEDPSNKGLSVSTKSFRHHAGLTATSSLTTRLQKTTMCSDGISVYEKITSLPSRKNIYLWDDYVTALVPHLGLVLQVRRSRCLRRRALRSYMLRDKALDEVCKAITAGSNGTTLVAFGGANSCSTGFGHAPAPQGRLRHRLSKHHNARVCIIDEFRTSRYCHQCQSLLTHATAFDQTSNRTVQIHHVLSCSECRNSKGCKQFWHRDFNAAKNILACYIAEARGEERPRFLCR
jgi:hypothetical protein